MNEEIEGRIAALREIIAADENPNPHESEAANELRILLDRLDSDAPSSVVLAYGDPASGFTFVSPVQPNSTETDAFIDEHLNGVDWWYVPILTIAEATERLTRH